MILTEIEKAMLWERMSGERLSDVERQKILDGGEFHPPGEAERIAGVGYDGFGERPAGCPPEVDAIDYDSHWPTDKPFPLTREEAWWLLQGYAVKPKADFTIDQLHDLPGKFELLEGYLLLWRT